MSNSVFWCVELRILVFPYVRIYFSVFLRIRNGDLDSNMVLDSKIVLDSKRDFEFEKGREFENIDFFKKIIS